MEENIIEIKNLCKNFGEVKAVNDISFKVKKGELFAFLGVNGAGKSTTISIICGSQEKTSGTVFVAGKNIDSGIQDVVSEIGVVFQNSVLDASLSVYDNLMTKANLYGIYGEKAKQRIEELSIVLEFSHLKNRIVGKLSGGERRRVDVARALLHRPKLLILDEPTTGLDPHTRKALWKVVADLRKSENLTVFLTTHYMEEATDADYVVILDTGKIVAEGTPLELKNKYTGDFITVYGDKEELFQKLNLPYEKIRDGFKISVKNTAEARDLIIKNPKLFDDFEITKGNMDDVFLAVTGKKLVGGN